MLKITPLSFIFYLNLFFAWIAFPALAHQAQPVSVQLAKVYELNSGNTVSDYLVSEKYDGVRAIWTGEQFVTRNGNPISAPAWFTDPLPNVWLDGELWTKRQDFAALSGIVRTQVPNEEAWRQVSYMVFDMPDSQLPFAKRYENYLKLIQQLNAQHVQAVEQTRFFSNHALSDHLQSIVADGAEGLMLHLATAPHQPGRSDFLLKLKPYFDEEAVVIAHLPGQGKYTGMLGALRVRNKQGVEFSVGSGFTDLERANPPPIGSTITYKYHGYTTNGLPRFASFLRIRED